MFTVCRAFVDSMALIDMAKVARLARAVIDATSTGSRHAGNGFSTAKFGWLSCVNQWYVKLLCHLADS